MLPQTRPGRLGSEWQRATQMGCAPQKVVATVNWRKPEAGLRFEQLQAGRCLGARCRLGWPSDPRRPRQALSRARTGQLLVPAGLGCGPGGGRAASPRDKLLRHHHQRQADPAGQAKAPAWRRTLCVQGRRLQFGAGVSVERLESFHLGHWTREIGR